METTFESTLKTYQRAVETYLNGCFTDKTQPQQTLFDAMRYSLLAGGKRIRPVLVLSSAACAAETGKRPWTLPRPWR